MCRGCPEEWRHLPARRASPARREALSAALLGWQLYRTQNREADLLTTIKALHARIAALQAEIRERDAMRMPRFKRKAGQA